MWSVARCAVCGWGGRTECEQCVVGVGGLGVSSVWEGRGHWDRGAGRLEGPSALLGALPGQGWLVCQEEQKLPQGSARFTPCLGRVPAARPLLKLGKSSSSVVIFISNCLFPPL